MIDKNNEKMARITQEMNKMKEMERSKEAEKKQNQQNLHDFKQRNLDDVHSFAAFDYIPHRKNRNANEFNKLNIKLNILN